MTSVDTSSEMQCQIDDLQAQLNKLIENKKAFEAAERELSPAQKLAIKLHKLLCTANHSDGCDWYYNVNTRTNVHDWNGHAHKKYLKMAERVISVSAAVGLNSDKALSIIKVTME